MVGAANLTNELRLPCGSRFEHDVVLNCRVPKTSRPAGELTCLFRLLGVYQLAFIDLNLLTHQDAHFVGVVVTN